MKRLAVAGVWAICGGGLLLAVFGASFYLAMQKQLRSTELEVPDLSGLTLEVAKQRAATGDLVLSVVDERHDPHVASGRVLEQMPPPGASVRRGRKVKLILSLGGEVLQVPELVGQASRAASIELRRQGFMAGEEAVVSSRVMPPGIIMAQVPPSGTPAVPSARIHRLVSQGPATPVWVMPDLVGLTRQEAERWLDLAGFRRGTVRRVSAAGQLAGSVVGQLPLSGFPIRSRDIVELTVAD